MIERFEVTLKKGANPSAKFDREVCDTERQARERVYEVNSMWGSEVVEWRRIEQER